MDKLKSTISYKQFDAPRPADAHTWPVIEKMARAKSAIASGEKATPVALAPIVAPVVAPPEAAAPRIAESSLFDRLHAEGRPRIETGEVEAHTSARFSRYATAKTVDDAPQALSAIFERIGRKAR
ncbi:hypothetical protein [Caulobacter sp. RL271]|jgi:hypothetical protein|uniref:Uncharacterized protein n=1 Tax=Caulobacter segnis TaxID=88688 RepID=A0ABY4ZPU1_9CAUL|nr:hypothetical protein [Caulobacter segnis]USQ94555.1 hypothetical protein MZV50_18480 [Caulobacter segnis]